MDTRYSRCTSRHITRPLLFLTYINDLPNNIHSIRLFADDYVLYREIKNEIDSQELQKDLKSLVKWEYDWQMNFNPQKMFCNENNTRETHAPVRLHIRRQITSGTDNHPYLGVHITKDLA